MRKFLAVLFLPLLTFSLDYEEILSAYQKSYLYERVGDYKDAIRVLMPVYKEYPNAYTVNLRLGWLYYLWGKYENSIYHYRKAVSAIPSSAEAKLGLSLPLMAQGKWKDVEILMYQVIASDYYNYYGNLRLSTALERQGKYYLQMAVAKKMLALYPTSVPFLIELGKAYYYLENYDAALKVFKDALVLDPENNTVKEFLQRLEEKVEKPAEEKKSSNST